MNKLTLWIGAFLFATIAVLTVGGLVEAQTTGSTSSFPAPMLVNIDANGNILLRGTVASVGTTSLRVNSWGGVWTVRNGSTTEIMARRSNNTGDMSSVSQNDFVGVRGRIVPDQQFTIDATLIRDWSTNPAAVNGTSTAAASMPITVGATTGVTLIPGVPNTGTVTGSAATSVATGMNLYTGTMSNIGEVGEDSFTLVDTDGNAYSVNTSTSTIFWNTARMRIPLSSMRSGDSIRLNGRLTGDEINATIVRDISI